MDLYMQDLFVLDGTDLNSERKYYTDQNEWYFEQDQEKWNDADVAFCFEGFNKHVIRCLFPSMKFYRGHVYLIEMTAVHRSDFEFRDGFFWANEKSVSPSLMTTIFKKHGFANESWSCVPVTFNIVDLGRL